ncbi:MULTISPECIES: hypothetical protein [Empedobacter]|uniref:hypothetical protein n=1 Tax=Empedobacter TaxID=59734 RepID=UPI001C57CFEB|nr:MULTISPECIES: hypothetical protein [Empedobacter]MBW1618648.1 DUF4468 domain-containing protein [Empedobacter falsenii]
MKILYTLFTIICLSQFSYAQYFTLTSNGFVSSKDKTDYIVIDKPNTKKNELYRIVLSALSSMYKDPKKVLSLAENESITINGYEQEALTVKQKMNYMQIGKSKIEYDLSYSITILFKDDKIRINRPSFEARKWNSSIGDYYYLVLNPTSKNKNSIYNKKNEVDYPDAVTGLENHFNKLIQEILDKSNKINNW